ncbi:hypothetical protein V6N12_054856 [Hibiscus sabdariffa]|uniref:Uncharacterized protein n=1 Tax=Hibiscus sabdariffa TaxID=183260 RepID=A0ABR2D4F8_9ROSI
MSWEDGGRLMGEADILGNSPIKGSTVNEEALKEDGLTVEDKECTILTDGVGDKPNWAEVKPKYLACVETESVSPLEELDPNSARLLENGKNMGHQSLSCEPKLMVHD